MHARRAWGWLGHKKDSSSVPYVSATAHSNQEAHIQLARTLSMRPAETNNLTIFEDLRVTVLCVLELTDVAYHD